MKRVLLMTVFGLVLASTAMAGMQNARFFAYWKPNYTGLVNISVPCPACPNGETVVPYAGCPNGADNSDPLTPNFSPNWNANPVETDTVAAKVFNPVPCQAVPTPQPSPLSPANGSAGTGTIYILVGRGGLEGISGVSFGVDWTPTTFVNVSTTFNYCIDGLSFPNDGPQGTFPRRQGGVRATWSTCQHMTVGGTVQTIIGYVKLTAPPNGMIFRVTPNNNLASGAELSIADCSNTETNLYTLYGPTIVDQVVGKIGFGTSADGYNPCQVTPTKPTTWGKIKSTYKN